MAKYAKHKCKLEQKHVNENSIEKIYWNYGYMMALKDVLKLYEEEIIKRN